MTVHRKAYEIGYGYSCEFILDLDAVCPGNIAHFNCEWDPSLPRISGKGAQQRFLARYTRARDDFMQDIAQLIGGNILNVDLVQHGNPAKFTPITLKPTN